MASLDLCKSCSRARRTSAQRLPIKPITCAQTTEVLRGLGHHVCAQLHDDPAQRGSVSGHVEEHLHTLKTGLVKLEASGEQLSQVCDSSSWSCRCAADAPLGWPWLLCEVESSSNSERWRRVGRMRVTITPCSHRPDRPRCTFWVFSTCTLCPHSSFTKGHCRFNVLFVFHVLLCGIAGSGPVQTVSR